jgi:hypothetical protein
MVERINPGNKIDLLEEIEREWSALLYSIEKLSLEEMVSPVEGGWSPKDNIAHLSEWMKILLGYHMDKRPAAEVVGVDPSVVKDWNFEKMNKIFYERNKDRDPEDVFDELKLVYSEVVARLESTPFEELMKPRFDDDPEKRPLLGWILGNTSEHFAEHRENIEKALH